MLSESDVLGACDEDHHLQGHSHERRQGTKREAKILEARSQLYKHKEGG